MFARVFKETKERFVFQIQGLQIAEDGLRFYIKPADGMKLPAIMKWMKQVFAQRYNQVAGREGHIWGDRYGSRIVEGEPSEVETEAVGIRVRPQYGRTPPYPSSLPPVLLPVIPVPE
jgi:REP element-mobilizing transposase RayT